MRPARPMRAAWVLAAALPALAGGGAAAAYECGAADARGRAVFPGPGAVETVLSYTGHVGAEAAAEVLAARLAARGIEALVLPDAGARALKVVTWPDAAAALGDVLAPGRLGFHVGRGIRDGGAVPAGQAAFEDPGGGGAWLADAEPFLTGAAVAEAGVGEGYDGRPVVTIRLDGPGARVFGDVTAAMVGQVIVVTLDGEVLTAPTVHEPILGGSLQLTGNFTAAEAAAIAGALAAGPLPEGMAVVSQDVACPGEGH